MITYELVEHRKIDYIKIFGIIFILLSFYNLQAGIILQGKAAHNLDIVHNYQSLGIEIDKFHNITLPSIEIASDETIKGDLTLTQLWAIGFLQLRESLDKIVYSILLLIIGLILLLYKF